MRILSVFLAATLTVLLSGATVKIPGRDKNIYVSNYENILGTSFDLKIKAVSEAKANLAETAALAEISRLDHILSAYNKQSEFTKWSNTRSVPVKVSPELFEVLSMFEQWKGRSNGALDASAEVVGRVWKGAAAENRQPSPSDLQHAVDVVKKQHYTLNKQDSTATRLDDAPLALNSFAKSYIAAKASDAAMEVSGVQGLVVNIGGDLVIRGDIHENVLISNPKADAENDLPVARLNISNSAIATSGNYRRGYQIGDKWYSHIVDPRTGKPVENTISATVVAPNASDAGALATAFNVLSVEESIQLASTVKGAEYLLITKEGKEIKSAGWESLELPGVKNAAAAPAANIWNDYEVAINLELSLIEGNRIHRPFVAVWIEDDKKKPVRNLSLWYNKPRWLPDLSSWYRVYGTQVADASTTSISSATRPAGKYTLKWDGRNDKGDYVKSGKYTVYIEVAREHGTHQLMKQELAINKKPVQATLPSNIEVASASLEYRKKVQN